MSILVVGSVAMDSVKTPFGQKDGVLGGSATYFSVAASLFNKVHLIATVGEDFPKRYLNVLKDRGIGIEGLHIVKGGRTFRWKGWYDYDLNTAHTISTHLNVFRDFDPVVPPNLRKSAFLFLANIDPELQLGVLKQISCPRLTACDSMNYWIETKRSALIKLLKKTDLVLLNDSEARQLTGQPNLIKASRQVMAMGPKIVVIKKGEHGVLCFAKNFQFVAPAYPLESICDPTGAGDTFAGGMMGFLSRAGSLDEPNIKKGIIYGSILASFAVEDFSISRLMKITMADIRSRYDHFKRVTHF